MFLELKTANNHAGIFESDTQGRMVMLMVASSQRPYLVQAGPKAHNPGKYP